MSCIFRRHLVWWLPEIAAGVWKLCYPISPKGLACRLKHRRAKMLCSCSNHDCSVRFSESVSECPACGSEPGPPAVFPVKPASTAFGTLFTCLLLLFVGIEIWQVYCSPFSGRLFDVSVWHQQAGSESRDNPRARMVHDLEWRFLYRGMSQTDVIELLGQPDWHKSDHLYSYNVGMWSMFRVDYDSFDLHFDGQRKLVLTRCSQH